MLKHHYYYPYHSSPSMNASVVMSSSASAAAAAATSWEEKAFAEDHAAGSSPLGCIWPPRSYSCSFCMREFRSAQALGGHMNVHRRDRARLKQCLHHNNTPHHPPALPDHRHGFAPFSPPPPPPPRAFLSSPNSFTAAAAAAAAAAPWSTDLSKVAAVMRSSGEEEEDCSNINIRLLGGGEVETDLSVGLIYCRGINRQSHGSSCKRPKIANTSPFPFFLQSAQAASMEEFEADLDLELRLGDPITPKVK